MASLNRSTPEGASLVDTSLVQAHGLASLVALLVAASFGIVVSIQLLLPDVGKTSRGYSGAVFDTRTRKHHVRLARKRVPRVL